MIDLHTHTFLSDGELLPEELVRRCETHGLEAVVVGDHVGLSNLGFVLAAHARLCETLKGVSSVAAVPGCELTHVNPKLAARSVAEAREAGARIVLGHGETLAEPVAAGSNRAYIEAGVDVLAHPGLISLEDARLAAERGVCLEVSARKGHCLANGHVVGRARESGAGLVFGTDAHAPGDLMNCEAAENALRGAGMSEDEIAGLWKRARQLIEQGEPR